MSPDPGPLTALTVSHAKKWNPAAFDQQALEWQSAAQTLRTRMSTANSAVDGSHGYWTGASGVAVRDRFSQVNGNAVKAADALTAGAAAARAAASDISAHRVVVVNKVTDAEANKYSVADDGTVSVSNRQATTLLASAGAAGVNRALLLLKADATQRTTALKAALQDLRTADVRAESAIYEAFKNLDTPPGFNPPQWEKKTLQPPPKDATVEENRHWWNTLTREQQADMIANQPGDIGNRDGIPADARDEANRNRLGELKTELETTQQTMAAMVGTDSNEYKAITARLDDLKAVEKAIQPSEQGPERKLMLLDLTSGRQARAAVAVGNPDKADHISVTAPGLNTTVRGSIENMTTEAENLQREAQLQLGNSPGRENETVSTIAWIGYDPPQTAGQSALGTVQGAHEVGTTERAQEGAVDLSRFYNGLEAAHSGGQSPHITAVGHSYGSLTTGLALQQPGGHPVSDMVVYGSPGIAADSPNDLGLQPGHAYVMRSADDPISWVQNWPEAAQTSPLVPTPPILAVPKLALPFVADAWTAADNGGFGPDPATNSNFTQLDTHAGFTADGRRLDGASGHSEYPQAGNGGVPRITTYNVAAVIAGLPTHVVPAR